LRRFGLRISRCRGGKQQSGAQKGAWKTLHVFLENSEKMAANPDESPDGSLLSYCASLQCAAAQQNRDLFCGI
jgi:hypothetical protein